jgi:hypothetical protein
MGAFVFGGMAMKRTIARDLQKTEVQWPRAAEQRESRRE